MEIDAFLCDFAQVAEGKLFANGGGFTTSWTPPQPPHVVSVSVAALVRVPWTATNEQHAFAVRVLDADGQPVRPFLPDGAAGPAIEFSTTFAIGRPAQLAAGDAQIVPFAVNFQGLPLPRLGAYTFSLEIDGVAAKALPLRVEVRPN